MYTNRWMSVARVDGWLKKKKINLCSKIILLLYGTCGMKKIADKFYDLIAPLLLHATLNKLNVVRSEKMEVLRVLHDLAPCIAIIFKYSDFKW